jgi:3-methyladenine DNA glycosylase AlkD
LSQLQQLKKDLRAVATKEWAIGSAKTKVFGEDSYGAGDIFLGVTVPDTRAIAKKYQYLSDEELDELAHSKYHEERLCALVILNASYSKAKTNQERKTRYKHFLSLLAQGCINNWDLIDVACPTMGDIFLRDLGYGMKDLKKLALSKDLWHRRASIILTFPLIRAGRFDETEAISLMLLEDDHHLIHKAVGWMLREMGKRDQTRLTQFIKSNVHAMSRTTLRYAIEKYNPEQRKAFLAL